MEKKEIVDSLFYSGGTLEEKDIIKTSSTCKYNIAINDSYMFIFSKENGSLIKTVKVEFQSEFTFKVMRANVKISKNSFIHMMTDDFWSCVARDAINNIVRVTKSC
jgi:serine/threonine protein phosphatase PrpC